MTKKELHLTTVAAVVAYLEANKLQAHSEKLTAILDEHLKPKSGGATVNIEEVVKRNADGKITQVQCVLSNKWLPATTEFFYEDKSEKPRIVNAEGIGLKRVSKQAESIKKHFTRSNKASIDALTDDILSLDVTKPEDQKTIAKLKADLVALKAAKPDYSKVSAKPEAKEAK